MDSKIDKGRIEFNDENYEKALAYFDSVSEDDEDYDYVLTFKITCLMVNEKKEALDALKKLERIISKDNKNAILDVARFYKFVEEPKRALRLCNMALAIDEDFEDAIHEKAIIAIALGNDEIVDNCANKLLDLVDGDKFKILLIFSLKLYCGKFHDCINIIDGLENVFEDETSEMLKFVVFNQLCEKLDVTIYLTIHHFTI